MRKKVLSNKQFATARSQLPTAVFEKIVGPRWSERAKERLYLLLILNLNMEGDLNYRKVLTKAMAMCSQSERCRFDVEARLRQWELSEEEIGKAIDYLIKERFLDDERYVRFYVNDKLRFNKWGKVKLAFMLRQKQIQESIVRESLNQIGEDLYQDTLRNLLIPKIKSLKGVSDYERKGKLAVFAQSHGFEAGLAFRIAAELIGSEQ